MHPGHVAIVYVILYRKTNFTAQRLGLCKPVYGVFKFVLFLKNVDTQDVQ